MPPARSFTDPGELPVSIQPLPVAHRVEVGGVGFRENRPHGSRAGVAQHHVIRVLQSVHSLDDDLVRIARPLHPGDVVVPQVPRNLAPGGRSTGAGHHAHPGRGIGAAGLGVLDRDRVRVDGIGVVDHEEVTHALGVELPVGDRSPIRAPPEPVPGEELLFVHPVERSVDQRLRAAGREADDVPGGHVLDEDVVLADVPHALAGRIELGEHETGFRPVDPQLPQVVRLEVEDPVVSPGVLPPDAT